MTIVLDASAATAWLTNEPTATEVDKLLSAKEDLIAPELIIAEIGNALWKKAMLGDFDVVDTERAFTFLKRLGVMMVPSEALIVAAIRLANGFSHPVYDCLYLALAQERGARVATLDKKMAAVAKAAAIPFWTPRKR